MDPLPSVLEVADAIEQVKRDLGLVPPVQLQLFRVQADLREIKVRTSVGETRHRWETAKRRTLHFSTDTDCEPTETQMRTA